MKDDDGAIRKNKPMPLSERPDWARSMPAKEWKKHVHSPQCKVCKASHDGRNLRSEIEALVIDRKTHKEVCNIIFERYGLQLGPHNISRHMDRHAPSYASVLDGLLQSKLDEVLAGAVGPIIDSTRFLLGVIQVSWQQLLLHPEEVSVADGIRATEKLFMIAGDLNVRADDNMVTQEEINNLLDIMQNIMTPEQIEEAKRRFLMFRDAVQRSGSSPPSEGGAPDDAEEVDTIVVDGERIAIKDIPTLPPEGVDE